jgi:hypothetical protein
MRFAAMTNETRLAGSEPDVVEPDAHATEVTDSATTSKPTPGYARPRANLRPRCEARSSRRVGLTVGWIVALRRADGSPGARGVRRTYAAAERTRTARTVEGHH